MYHGSQPIQCQKPEFLSMIKFGNEFISIVEKHTESERKRGGERGRERGRERRKEIERRER